MKRDAARELIRDTFESPFEKKRFEHLVRNLLNHLDASNEARFTYSGNTIRHAYAESIKSLERIGKYTDPKGSTTDVLVVNLRRAHTLEHARTMQRNFIAWYLNGSRGGQLKDAALVAFHADDSPDWRFSLVRMDYRLAKSEGKVQAITELTPARRFSFLVGQYEKTHTAQKQLLPLLEDDEHNPLLSDLEQAFSIETVTKEFFGRYRDLFLETKDALDKVSRRESAVREEFSKKGIDTTDFAKKLLGQIVFLYFLQKKGWFGVARTDTWGSGPKNFLRQLFEKKHGNYQNFFNDILESLFYEALAKERDNDFYSRFNCKIPFLNGGLFDPIYNYDWVHTDILLPDRLFSNTDRTKEGDVGTGILDVLDRYNFTVKEDEPLDKDVAVDPEMLGKVFENLLEVKDRKSKGTYYTPREIVHYMCQESLVNYLTAELEGTVSQEDIETLIKYGETAVEHDRHVEEEGETPTYQHRLPESVRKHAKLIDEKLADIQVCDPAVGSGAFPVGMMNEIVRTRNALTNYIESKNDRSMYEFKRHAIQHSLYGVDIDPGAVEIAKLRLWLSLVVDEEDIREIKPLPNLDYKIMQGNSLVEEFEGIKLFDEKLMAAPEHADTVQVEKTKERMGQLQREYIQLHMSGKLTETKKQELNLQLKQQQKLLNGLTITPKKKSKDEVSLFDRMSEARKKADELQRLHQEFFGAASGAKKNELRKRIENLEWEFIEVSLREQRRGDVLKKVAELKKANTRPFFLWKLHFADAFQKRGGFDVVIANPPYGADYDHSYKKYFVEHYRSAKTVSGEQKGSLDTFSLFIDLGLFHIGGSRCVLNYIVPLAFTSSESMSALHSMMLKNCERIKVSSYSNRPHKIFESADQRVSIVLAFKNNVPTRELLTTKVIKRYRDESLEDIIEHLEFSNSSQFVKRGRIPRIGSSIELSILGKLFKINRTLRDYIRNEPTKQSSDDAVFYRVAGGRYYNIVTNFPTNSTQEKCLYVQNIDRDLISALLSSNLYYWFAHIYSDTLHLKSYELEIFPIPEFSETKIRELKAIYAKYVTDLERHAEVKKASYKNASTYKQYYARYSKHLIDEIDRNLWGPYGLTEEEANFLINYDAKFRTEE